RREACPSDRRSSFAVVTEAGRQRLEEALPGHLALIQEWLIDPLTPGQLAGLQESLRIIRDAVNPCATAGSSESTVDVA
ncbi:MAG TPA: MarR family transcriptional regulator, partial [Actinoplanes sp.]